MTETHDEFYIGYLPKAPASLASWLRGRVALCLIAMVGVPLALVFGMTGFSAAAFEFGNVREFVGEVRTDPYPVLLMERPGLASVAGAAERSSFFLVAEGKFGADALVQGLDGKHVQLEGTLIYRDDRTMIEVVPGSLSEVEGTPLAEPLEVELGSRTLFGEIVDSKCFLGVMKPGNLKPHRACATRCISGGVPPVLLVRDEQGHADYYLLVSEEGGAVNADVLEFVAEPISITGRIVRRGDLRFLYADPATYQRLP